MKRRKFRCQRKSESAGKLPLLLKLALLDANRARRIALANRFRDWQEFGFAMQVGTAGNVKELITIILGYCYKSRHRRVRRILVAEARQGKPLPRENCKAQRHRGSG
jgi:hypothetical protein